MELNLSSASQKALEDAANANSQQEQSHLDQITPLSVVVGIVGVT